MQSKRNEYMTVYISIYVYIELSVRTNRSGIEVLVLSTTIYCEPRGVPCR